MTDLAAMITLTAGGMLAEAATGFDFAPLVNVGAIGVILAWFLWKHEPRIKAIEDALDRLSRTQLLFLIELPHVSDAAKREAKIIIQEIAEAEAKRK